MNDLELAYNKAFNLKDLLTCIKIAKHTQNFSVDLNELKNAVINSKNPLFCINYVKWLKPKDKKPFEKVILDSQNAHIASVYAMENKDDCNLIEIEKLILEKGDAYDCVDYICNIQSERQKDFEQKIINEEEAYACYLYCLKFQPFGRDLKPFQDIVIDSDDMQTIFNFAKDIYDANICALAEVAFDFGSSEDKLNFAYLLSKKYDVIYDDVYKELETNDIISDSTFKEIQRVNNLITRLEDDIIKYGSLDDVKDFLLYIPYADSEKLQKIIENSKRRDLKYEIAMSEKVDLKSVADSICRDLREERRF